jgi:transcriptional regulator with XRE-family HTH domain
MSSKEVDQLLADLRKWCEPHGRQQQLADALGLKKAIVSHWINGRRKPSLDGFFKIQEFLKEQKKRKS